LAKHANLDPARDAARQADVVFDSGKAEIISVLESELATRPDAFLSQLKGDLEKLELMSPFDIAEQWSPKGEIFTRDKIAMGQGYSVPAHINALAEVASLRRSFDICKKAANIAKKAASHLERKERKKVAAERVGTNVRSDRAVGHVAMGRIEKTVFVSYRRTDESWGLAIFQNLTQHGYDVFIDYEGIASGDFEAAILENIRA